MPLRWTVDHDARLIMAEASGALSRQEFDDYMAAVAKEGAVGYRVLFDAQAASVDLRADYLLAFSQVVRDRKRPDVSDGRIAVVVGSDAEDDLGAFFVEHTSGARPCRLFHTIADARVWLEGPWPPPGQA